MTRIRAGYVDCDSRREVEAARAFVAGSGLAPSMIVVIARARDEGDGRRVMLSIAPAGVALLRAVSPDSARIYDALEAQFGRERVEQLLELLDELARLKA